MANTIMSAKNSFEEGLLMDLSPDNTQANCMTSALNATLLTFNGNEMLLLNDMGNGRVETARLPEGYVPLGTCEFGDIIYVVSYNPLINKSLIGCFPSPERNISSEEIGGLELILTWSDFLAGDGAPNGRLKASSVKKILYDSNNMSSGDKYIIYSENIANNSNYLSDYGNTPHQHGKFPKLVKVHVVSIEESGKIVYLDSTTKWYSENNFYIHPGGEKTSEGKLDIDSYRTMVSSAYSIFSSKVSGKLALLVELEKITGFSCSWEPYVTNIEPGDTEYTTYSIYWNFNWTTDDNNINPNGAMLMVSEWTGTNSSKAGLYLLWDYSDSKLGLKNWESADEVPSPFEEGTVTLSNEFSRGYKPEYEPQNITYDKFIKEYEYNTYLNKTLSSLKIKNSYKINLYKEKSEGVLLPKLGNYIINCNETKGDKYYNRSSDGKSVELKPLSINDDIINNHFHYPVVKKFNDFKIPTKQSILVGDKNIDKVPNIDNLIYHYKIAPTMPYGILEGFTQEGYIDFSKIGKKNISLNTWKYYNYENTSTLTWGMEAYTEPNKGISEVVFEFYDNQGFVAAYHNKGKMSYNGTFTEYITLNESGSNYKLNNIKAFPDYDSIYDSGTTVRIEKPTYHKGNKVTKEIAVPGFMYFNGSKWIDYSDLLENKDYYQDDSGTLYSNCLYLVKIIIKYCDKGVLGEYQEPTEGDKNRIIEDYRWFWTNTMYNDRYYQLKDFKDIDFSLSLDVQALYSLKRETLSNTVLYQGIASDAVTEENKNEYLLLKANVTYINLGEDTLDDKEGNILSLLQVGLVNDYGTFLVSREGLKNIEVRTYLGTSYLENDSIDTISTENLSYVFDGIYPINDVNNSAKAHDLKIGDSLLSLMGYEESSNSHAEINEKEDSYKNYTNTLNITFPTKNESSIDTEEIEYVSYNQETKKTSDFYKCLLNEIEYNVGTGYIDFTLSGIIYSKFYELKSLLTTNVTVIKPLLYDYLDLDTYNMDFKNNHFYFKNIGGLCVGDDGDGDNRTRIRYFKGSANQETYNAESFGYLGRYCGGKSAPAYLNLEVQQTNEGTLSELFPGITPFILIRDDNYGRDYSINAGKDNVDNAKIYPATSGEYYNYFGTFSNPIGEGIRTNLSTASNKNSFMILALNDKEGQLHFLNTYIPVRYLKNSYVSLNIRYGSTEKTYKPQTIGDAVAATLMSLYYTSGLSETTTFLGTYNFVKLNNYKNIYTKDIIYNVLPPIKEEITNDSNHNELILIRGIYFDEYISEIMKLIDKEDKAKVNCTNINLNLKGTIKNYPILFVFPYITPILQSVISPKYVIKSSEGKHISTMTGITKDMLYFLDPKNEQSLIRINDNTTFIYNPITDFKYSDSGLFIGTKNPEVTITNSSLGKAFSLYQELLVCRNTSENISDRSSYTINGKEEKWSGVWPLHRDEVLLPMGKLA